MASYVAGQRVRHGGVRRIPACLLAALLAGLVLAGAAGCADDPPVEWPADPTGGPASTLDPAEAEAIDQILTAFYGFRQAEVAVQADPQSADQVRERLVGYLADPLLSLALFEVETMHRRGLVREGQPTWQPEVVDLRLADDPPAATVRDCLDTTGWELADRDSGNPAPADGLPARFQPDRYVMEFNAKLVDGEWLFDDARVESDAQC